MAYIEVRTTLPDHRKAKSAARELGMRRPWLIGHLVCLWAWALDNVPLDGFIGGIPDADLEEAAQWPEDRAGELVPALIDAGFIDDDASGRYLHDWDDYAGRLLKRREEDRARKAAERAAKRAEKVSGGRPADRSPKPRRKRSTPSTPPTVDKSRPADTPKVSSGHGTKSDGKAPVSATPPRAGARPHRTAPTPSPEGSEKREAPPARPRAKAAGSAGIPLGIEQADPRHPVAAILAGRFGWTACSEAEWDAWWEEVDNEYPAGTTKGADRKAGWRWLAEQLADVPRDVADPKRWFFEQRQAVKAERLAKADADEAAWAETKARYADDAGPIADQLAETLGKGATPKRNGHVISHDKAVTMLRSIRGTVDAGPWQELLARYQVSEEELDAHP